jgi:hypothetical protein
LKATAPIAARQAVNIAERYGVSPTMNIIPPQGNLNLTTRLDEQIKGPETQTVFDLLKQVQGKPGVTKEGLKVIAQNYPDSAARITKQEFAQSIPPSQYSKVDLKQAAQGDIDQYMDMAHDMVTMDDAVRQAGIPDRFHNDALMLQYGDIEFSQLDPQSQRILGRIYGIDDTMDPNDIMNTVEDINYEYFHDTIQDTAMRLAEDDVMAAGYPYEGIQRLVQSQAPHDYFEFGVTHPSQTGEYKHYRSGEAPEGLVGHVRGSYASTEPLELKGGITTKPNSYVIEEIQSDAQKGVEQTGPLHQVHGTLLKSAVQDAAERGADYVYVPTSYPISDTRGLSIPEDYAAIYDKAVMKEGLDPLRKIPGIEINTLEGRHLKRNLDIVDAPYYHEIKLSPEAREYILTGPGQQVPGYAAGGLVASDYDEEQIDKLSDSIFETAPSEGGVSYRDYPNPYGLRAYRNKDGSYGGEMLPKAEGWAGEQRGRGNLKGSTVTEYSMDDERGSFPSINPLLSLDEIDAVAAGNMTPEIYKKAVEWRDLQARHGESAFKNPTGFAKGGEVKDPFADLSVIDKAKLLAKAAKYRVQYNKQAKEHGKYPDILSSALKEKYLDEVGNSRVNRSPLDAAINYGGGYDFGVRGDIPIDVARDMAKAYQYTDYFFSPFTGPKADAVGDYYENMAGVEAGIKERARRASEADIARRSAEYGRRTSKMLPQYEEPGYAEGGAVNTDISKYYTNASMPGLTDLQAKYYTPLATFSAPTPIAPLMNSYSSTTLPSYSPTLPSYSPTLSTPIAQPDLAKYGISSNQFQQLNNLADSSNWLQNYNQAKPVTVNPDLNELAKYYAEQSAVPKPVAPAATMPQATAPVATPTVQSVTKAPMYTKHEGMLFGDDFYDRYAQNVGGQYADPYHNFLMTQARVFGPDSDLPNLYKQYQASGRTDTPDWATLDTTNPISKLPLYAHSWDASGANPVDNLSWAWNSTTPLVEGITVPEGYWDAVLAYNMNLSKWNPTSNTEKFDPEAYKEYNAAAYNAMAQGIYDNNHPAKQNYMSPKARAAAAQSRTNQIANTRSYYDRMRANNIAWGQQNNISVDKENSEIDELEEEFLARMEAEAAAEQAMQASISYGGGSSGYNFGYASPSTRSGSSSSTSSSSGSSGYTPTNTNIGMGGVSGPANMGGGTKGPKYAKGGLVYNDEEINNLADQLLGA